MTRLVRIVIPLLAAAGLVLAACGDDGANVRDLGDSGGSASGSVTGSGSGSGIAAEDKDCTPVGEDLEDQADATVELQLGDYQFVPSDIEVDAGVVTFATTNIGEHAHELAFLPGDGDVPFTEDGEPDEAALEERGAFELEAYGPGQDCNATYRLEPGEYTIFCIVQAEDGETHYEKGMRGTLTVN